MIRQTRDILLAAACCALASCSSVGTTAVKNTSRTFTTVVVDPGHGGKDNGAFRRFSGPEKAANLDVALRLAKKLRESQFHTVMTRSGDVFIPLEERAAIGRSQRNSIFVSIHFNDSPKRRIRGFETYYRSPAAYPLAQRIQQRLLTIRGAANRGVRTANFRVLRKAIYPAVLVECGFLSNRGEGGEAGSAGYREQLADKIAEAIVEERYGSGVYRAPANPPNSVPPSDTGAEP
ncbi:MAG: N-acetylmuramoyl-L-alanine amidase [Verrucomicrobiota bacterium]|nr:N-acetylmuramoyl-L-alanine amidase [Verrucomicrobiota bacterium]